MSDKTHIEWTDATWNPVTGCSKVSAGCKHCYAEREWTRLSAPRPKPNRYTGRDFTDVACHDDVLDQPMRWTKPRRIFVNSMGDLFHEDVPDEFIDKVFAVMARARHHVYQVLTKRADRMAIYLNSPDRKLRILQAGVELGWAGMMDIPWPIPHVWLGVSVEDQAAADERIPLLLQTPAALRWISAEPLLGPVDLNRLVTRYRNFHVSALHEHHDDCYYQSNAQLDWVVAGGESGPKARPMHPNSVRSLRDQCKAAGVPFLFKQWGEWWPAFDDTSSPEHRFNDGERMFRIGKKSAGRLLDGVLHDEYPQA